MIDWQDILMFALLCFVGTISILLASMVVLPIFIFLIGA